MLHNQSLNRFENNEQISDKSEVDAKTNRAQLNVLHTRPEEQSKTWNGETEGNTGKN